MRNNKLHTPDGVRDYLPKDYSYKREIEQRVESVFHRYGYFSVASPTIEYMEVFYGTGSVKQNQIYRFIDRDGETLALRCDNTPPVARIAATNYTKKDMPLRLCYVKNIFKDNEQLRGKTREITQAGVELIGASSPEADAEVIATAINSLIAAGLKDFQIDIGQFSFFEGILEESGLDQEICNTLQNYIIEKDFVSAEQIVKEKNVPENILNFFSNLPLFSGKIEILDEALEITNNLKCKAVVENLKIIYYILKDYGLHHYILFDLSMAGHLEYYTGIIFRAYTLGVGFSIVEGGRYDNLISEFGADFPSVGFTIRINDLISALENQNVKIPFQKADTLVVYTKAGRKTALMAADELRSQGLFIENSFLEDNLEENILFAKNKGIDGILYFADNDKVKLINLLTDEVRLISINELIKERY